MQNSHPIWSFLRKHLGVFAVLIVTCLVGLWFVADMFMDFLYFNDPQHQDAALKPWMTPRYVVMSYDLPRAEVAEILGLTTEDQRGMTMRDIAVLNDMSLDELTEKVRTMAETYRSENGS